MDLSVLAPRLALESPPFPDSAFLFCSLLSFSMSPFLPFLCSLEGPLALSLLIVLQPFPHTSHHSHADFTALWALPSLPFWYCFRVYGSVLLHLVAAPFYSRLLTLFSLQPKIGRNPQDTQTQSLIRDCGSELPPRSHHTILAIRTKLGPPWLNHRRSQIPVNTKAHQPHKNRRVALPHPR